MTRGEIELGGGVFPVEPGETKGTLTLTPCKPAKNGWMRIVEVDADPESGYLTLKV